MLNALRPSAAPINAQTGDAELAARGARGDEVAFEAIMRRHNQLLFRTARSIVKNDAEAEDVVQEAYLRAWRALGSFRADAKLSTWLVRIVANEAFGRLRRKQAPVIPLDAAMISPEPAIQAALTDEPNRQPEPAAMRAELRQLLESRIDRLPDVFRTVFMLRAVEEMSVEEVAQALGIPEATVRTRFSVPAACCARGWPARSTPRWAMPLPSTARAATASWPACSAGPPPRGCRAGTEAQAPGATAGAGRCCGSADAVAITPPPRQTSPSYSTALWPGVTAHWGWGNASVKTPGRSPADSSQAASCWR
jgi:RNA polymerase sigma-70 factor (ECF subfamily)